MNHTEELPRERGRRLQYWQNVIRSDEDGWKSTRYAMTRQEQLLRGTAAITAPVDAVEQMQSYYSIYLPSLFYSIAAPVYLFFRLKRISLPVAVLMLVVSLVLLPAHNLFRRKSEQIRRRYSRVL